MSEATLQTLAYELGIEKLVRNMTEAEKAQLRYIQIMKSSSEWQTDMGRTLISPANALRVMRQQFSLLGRAIGKIFIPIVMEAMPYVIALTQLLTNLANKLAEFFGYKITDIDYSNLGEISSGITNIGDSAEDTANKLNTMLAPFDDLNVVQKQTEKTGSGLGAFGGDLGLDLQEYNALANLNTKFAEGVENAKNNLEKLIPIVTTLGISFASWKIASSIANFMTWWDELGKSSKNFLTKAMGLTIMFIGISYIFKGVKDMEHDETFIEGLTKSLGGTIGAAAGAFILTKNVTLTLAITALSTLFASGVALKDLLDMKPTFDEFVRGINELPWAVAVSDYILTPIFIDTPKKIEEFVIGLGTNIGNWIGDYVLTPLFIDIPNNINNFLTELSMNIGNWIGDTIWNIIDGARELKDGINNKLDEMSRDFPNKWSDMWTKFGNKLSESKNNFISSFDNLKINISNRLQELKNMFSNWKATLKTPHLEWKQNGIQASGTIKKILETLNLPTSLPKLNVSWYEHGGYPTSGDLFFANENGIPEMIGRIGNKTAVANNDQITTSLTNSLISALDQYDLGGEKSPTIIYIGPRKVYEGYGEYVENENDRYGTNMIRI